MIQGVNLNEAYQTVQTFLGGYFVNYFNRFGLQWQVYVQAEGEYRTNLDNLGMFYLSNKDKEAVPVNSFIKAESSFGPEFTMRYNMFRCSQINASVAPGYSTSQAMKALEEVFAQTMPPGMGYDYFGMSYQEQQAAQGAEDEAQHAVERAERRIEHQVGDQRRFVQRLVISRFFYNATGNHGFERKLYTCCQPGGH